MAAQILWLPNKLTNISTFAAYLFARPAKKDKKATTRQPITPAETTIPTPLAPHNFEPIFSPIPEPVKVAESLYVERQHSFFGSMLKDKEEGQTSKLRREEDNQWRKALLKQFVSRFHPKDLM